MRITRRKALPAIASLGAVAASPAFGQQTSENVKWRLTSSFPKSLDTLFGASLTIARVVGEMTDGKFVLTPFGAGESSRGSKCSTRSPTTPSSAATPIPATTSARIRR